MYDRDRRIHPSGTIEFTYINDGVPLAVLLRVGHFTLFHEVLLGLLLDDALSELVQASAGGVSHVLCVLILRHMLLDTLPPIFSISRRENLA